MIVVRDNKCPCGSGYKLFECCLPDNPSLVRRQQGFKTIDVNAQFTLPYVTMLLPQNLNIVLTVRNPNQLNQVILDFMKDIVELIAKYLMPEERLKGVCDCLQAIDESLHLVKYHQQNFLYRLRLLTAEHLIEVKYVTGNVDCLIDDLPLRHELSQFLSSVTVVLDVLAKLTYTLLGDNPHRITHRGLVNDLKKYKKQKNIRGQLYLYYTENESWIKETKKIRNPT